MKKRVLSMILAVVIVLGLLPTNVFAEHDNSGKPTDMTDEVVVALYKGNDFPGEPAVYSTSNYVGFGSNFQTGANRYATSASTVLKPEVINQLKLGTPSWGTTVWGYYDTAKTDDYFLDNSPLLQEANQNKMIQAVAGSGASTTTHEIVWYVIKYQANSWYGDQWHINGIVKEKSKYSVNYYGNGNTAGGAPTGVKDLISGSEYTIKDKPSGMKRVVNNVESKFLGWNTAPDGSGTTYQPGAKITVTEDISLYAMWETVTVHTATVNTYLNNIKRDIVLIHDESTKLYIGLNDDDLIELTKSDTGTYTATVSANGNYYLYHSEPDGGYHKMDDHILTIYNANGSLDVHHYSVGYDPDGGVFDAGQTPATEVYYSGTVVNAITQKPTKEGYLFMGWQDPDGKVIEAGEQITDGISKVYTMTALWAEADKVKVNVTINHKPADGGAADTNAETMHKVNFGLLQVIDHVNQPTSLSKYLTKTDYAGYAYAYDAVNKVTTYTATDFTFTNLVDGVYTVSAIKSDYATKVVTTDAQGNLLVDADGNQIINVILTYEPGDYDLYFDVVMVPNAPKELYPQAVNVKVTYWGYDANGVLGWHTFAELEGDAAPITVTIDPATGKGSGFYPMWKYWSDTTNAYEYRVVVTSYVLSDGTVFKAEYSPAAKGYVSTNALYSGVVTIENGGRVPSYPDGSAQTAGASGAYFDGTAQNGRPTVTVSVNPYSVTFDAQGGTVNGQTSQKVDNLWKVPGLEGYVPVRGGGYVFDGWYKDQQYTQSAVAGEGLNGDITLYAKWKEPLTVSGTVTIAGTYEQAGQKVNIHDVNKATEALVILQELRDGSVYDVASKTVTFGSYGELGSADYSFTGIADDGKQHRIYVALLNYTTTFDNESDADAVFTPDEYKAVFGVDTVAQVDAHLSFTPENYDQTVRVEADQIGESFRPTGALAQIFWRDYRSSDSYLVISQHTVSPYGVLVTLNSTGRGSGVEGLWKYQYDATHSEYILSVSKLYGNVEGIFTQAGIAYDPNTTPYVIVYSAPTYWDAANGVPSGDLVATLVPRTYQVTFDLAVPDGETVTGMDAYAISGGYGTTHKWSFDTAISAQPQRTGYVFKGWEAANADLYADGKIPASVHEAVTLVAQWEPRSDLALTVNHVDYYTGKVLETETVNNRTFGQVVTADSLKNTYPDYQFHSASAQSVTIGTGTNEITLRYEKDAYGYTVQYLHKTTGTVLQAAKSSAAAFGSQVTETAPTIAGYVVVGDASQTFTMDADNKVITFYYTERTDIDVTVIYMEKNTNNKIHEDRIIDNVRFGAKVNLQPEKVNIPGFTFHSIDPVCQNDEYEVKAEGNVITLYYSRNSYGYTVEYYYDGVKGGTNSDSKPFEEQVSENFAFKKTYGGKNYIFDYAVNNPLTIGLDAASNVIKGYYLMDADGNDVPDIYEATVTYKIVNGTWNGTAGNDRPITKTFPMRRFDDETMTWVATNATLGSTIPTGMVGNTGYTDNLGTWDEPIGINTPVVDKNEYTYAYTLLDEHIITAVVTGGTVTVKLNGSTVDAQNIANYSKIFHHSDSDNITMEFAPNTGYTLEYVSVDGRFYTAQEILNGTFGEVLTLDRKGDHAVIVHYAMDANGDNIPDKYQKKVTYKVVNGTWNNGSVTEITEWVTLTDAQGNWSETGTGKLANVPAGMKPAIGYTQTGAWNVPAVSNDYVVSGSAPVTYTYAFTEKITITITIEVVNGTSSSAASTEHFHYDADRTTTATFTPNSGYMLESVTINGQPGTLTNGSYTYGYTENLTIRVVYTKDSVGNPTDPDNKGDGIPDKYQKRIVLCVVNGTWDGTNAADKVFYVTLMNGNVYAENGSATFTVPTGMKANTGYKGGAWDIPVPTGTVTGTDEVVYTYRFTAKQYVDFTYTVEHYKQLPDGTYVLFETETITIPNIELNLEGTAFEEGTVSRVAAVAKDYGSHYLENGEHIDRVSYGTPVYGRELVLKLHYFLDSHKVSYDFNGGAGAVGVDYSDAYIGCGNTVTVKRVPTRVGYVFKGWLADGVSYAAGSTVTVNDDITFVAQWEKQTGLSYMIFYLEQGTGKILASTVQKTNGTFEDVIKASDYVISIPEYTFMNADRQELVLDMDVTQNFINLYYARDVLSTDPEDADGDGIADKYQVTIRYEVTPDGKGTVVLKQEVLTIYGDNQALLNAGKVTISGTKADPITGWKFYNWTDATGAVISAQRTLTPMQLEVEGGKTYTFTATLVPEASVVDPQAAAYKVEHYIWNDLTKTYELKDTELLVDLIGKNVNATAKTYAGFALNTKAAGYKPSGIVTMPATVGGEMTNLLTLKLYYDVDVIGGSDNVPDIHQAVIRYEATPSNKGTVALGMEVITVENGKVTISGTTVTPATGWKLKDWTNDAGVAASTALTLAPVQISAEGGKTYTFTATLVPEASVVDPQAAAYKVEHYKWNAASGAYELADMEMFAEKLGATVTATAKSYTGFVLNKQASGHKPSGTVTMPKLNGTELANLLVLKLYYDADVIGPDNIPDRYQKKITFRVVNGTWGNTRTAGNSADIVIYVTLLDAQGNWSETGTARLTVPAGMQPNIGYEGGAWDITPPTVVSGTGDAVYTYIFTAKPETNPNTADAAAFEMLLVLMLLSAAGFITVMTLCKKKYLI